MGTFRVQRRHIRFLALGFLVMSWASAPVQAAEPQLALQALIEEALERNPEIRGAHGRWEAGKAVRPQVETLPDPILAFGYRGPDIMREGRLHLQQDIPFPGKLGLRGEVAAKAAEQAGEIYRATRFRIIAQLKESYFTLHFVHKSLGIVKKNLKILDQFEKTAEVRYKVGKGIQQDIFRAQVALSREIERLTTLEQEKESLHAALNRILNRPPAAPLGTPGNLLLTPLSYTLGQLNEHAMQNSPVIKAQVRGIEREESAVDLARREYYPDFFVGVGAMQSFRSSDLQDAFGIFGIKVPLYYATKQRFGVKEALSSLESARQDHNTASQDILFRVKDNLVRVQRAARLAKLLEKAIIPQAALALESSMAGYAVGKVNFLTMLDNVLTLQQDELDLHREKTDHEIAIARLEEVVGMALQGTNP